MATLFKRLPMVIRTVKDIEVIAPVWTPSQIRRVRDALTRVLLIRRQFVLRPLLGEWRPVEVTYGGSDPAHLYLRLEGVLNPDKS